MLHISICDDERIAVEKMQRKLWESVGAGAIIGKLRGLLKMGKSFCMQYVIRDDELVILDLDMPVKNGIDVIQELERIQRNEVVILVTAYDNLALTDRFLMGHFRSLEKNDWKRI
ncbi:MAG: response regulator [Dorea sp.]